MKPESVINYLLTHDAPLSALVGVNIYPVVLPKGISPSQFVVYKLVSDVPQPTIDANSTFKLSKARVQVTLEADTYENVKALVESVKAVCDKKSGIIASVKVVSCLLALEGPDDTNSATGFFMQSIDFQIYYHG